MAKEFGIKKMAMPTNGNAGAALAAYASRAGIESLRGVPGRFESVEAGQPFSVIVDYAHTPDSLENVLRTARELGPASVAPFLREWLYGATTPPMPGHPDWTVDPPPTAPPVAPGGMHSDRLE